MKRSIIYHRLFIIVSLTELVAVTFGWKQEQFISKPFIMLLLIGYYLSVVEKRSLTFIVAMLFCWAGDVILLFQTDREIFFIAGLIAFLAGHFLYILSYRQFQWTETKNELMPTQKIRYSFPIILAGTGLVTILFPTLGALKIPVTVYAIVLMVMVVTALFRYGRTTPQSFWMVFAGAALFMISDSLLAINKFYFPFACSGPIIMFTYISAQYLIVDGAAKHQTAK